MLAFPYISWASINPNGSSLMLYIDIFKSIALTIIPIWVAYINVRNSNRKDRRDAENHKKDIS